MGGEGVQRLLLLLKPDNLFFYPLTAHQFFGTSLIYLQHE